MPLETLANGYGDCDTKSVLFGSLLSNFKGTKLILVQSRDHMFVGVKATPRPGDHYVRIRNEYYVLAELTFPWLLGHIPTENWRGLKMKKFKIFRVL